MVTLKTLPLTVPAGLQQKKLDSLQLGFNFAVAVVILMASDLVQELGHIIPQKADLVFDAITRLGNCRFSTPLESGHLALLPWSMGLRRYRKTQNLFSRTTVVNIMENMGRNSFLGPPFAAWITQVT